MPEVLLEEQIDALVLDSLDFNVSECCYHVKPSCMAPVGWRAICRLCDGVGELCDAHMVTAREQQRRRDLRGGQRCTLCDATAKELLIFEPIVSSAPGRLW